MDVEMEFHKIHLADDSKGFRKPKLEKPGCDGTKINSASLLKETTQERHGSFNYTYQHIS